MYNNYVDQDQCAIVKPCHHPTVNPFQYNITTGVTDRGGRWTKYCDNNNALFIAVHVYATQKPQFSDKTNKQ